MPASSTNMPMLPAHVRPPLPPPLCKSATFTNDSAAASSPQACSCHPPAHSICTRCPLLPANLPPWPASPPVPPARLPDCALTSSVHLPQITLYNQTCPLAHVSSLLIGCFTSCATSTIRLLASSAGLPARFSIGSHMVMLVRKATAPGKTRYGSCSAGVWSSIFR